MTTEIDTKPRSIACWFTRGSMSAITIPVFLLLVAGTVAAFFQVGIRGLLVIWPFSLLIPGWLWWAVIKETPSIYAKEAATTSRSAGVRQAVVTVILLVAFSAFMQWGHGKIIGWIADRDPDAAYRAGVTGSRPPSSFQDDN